MAKAIEMKKEVVNEITDKLKKSTSTILVDYRGLKVDEVTELRKQCREKGLEYKVYKNTLVRMAAKNAGMEDILEELVGPNAIVFSYDDPIAATKTTSDFAKEHEALELKAGYIEGAYYKEDRLQKFAAIPSREELIAKLLSSLKAPVSNFAYLVKAVIDKKEAEGQA